MIMCLIIKVGFLLAIWISFSYYVGVYGRWELLIINVIPDMTENMVIPNNINNIKAHTGSPSYRIWHTPPCKSYYFSHYRHIWKLRQFKHPAKHLVHLLTLINYPLLHPHFFLSFKTNPFEHCWQLYPLLHI